MCCPVTPAVAVFPLVDFMASYRVTKAFYGADLELSLVRSENGHVMTRKLSPSGLFSLTLPEVRIVPLNYLAKVGRDIRVVLIIRLGKEPGFSRLSRKAG